MHKRKLEIAKKEQIDRFAQAAAHSGLLNGLNPGIINHVRNSKQVHSIIEAVSNFARTENQQFGSHQDDRNNPHTITKDANSSKVSRSVLKQGEILSGSKQIRDFHILYKSIALSYEIKRHSGNSYMGKTRIFGRLPSQFCHKNEDDALVLKLSSSASIESEKTTSLSNEESANSTLSINASQWLELLSRSKQRVRNVVKLFYLTYCRENLRLTMRTHHIQLKNLPFATKKQLKHTVIDGSNILK